MRKTLFSTKRNLSVFHLSDFSDNDSVVFSGKLASEKNMFRKGTNLWWVYPQIDWTSSRVPEPKM